MKKALFDTVTVLPYTSGSVIDRLGYESAVLAVTVATSKSATVKIEHCDTETGTFEAVPDSRVFVDNPVDTSGQAVIANESEAEIVANLDIDLLGCKEYVKLTVTNGTAGAIALGDATDYPVKYPVREAADAGDDDDSDSDGVGG